MKVGLACSRLAIHSLLVGRFVSNWLGGNNVYTHLDLSL